MVTAWNESPGLSQGRIQPTGSMADAGAWVFVLGHDLPGQTAVLNPGDYHEVAQTCDLQTGPAQLVRFSAYIRGPAAPTAGVYWRFSVLLDGAEVAYHDIQPTESVSRVDMGINVATVSGDHALQFRLELLGAGGPYDVELPAVYIDQVVLVATSRLTLFNRFPEELSVGVPVNQTICFDLGDNDATGATFDMSTVEVYINSVLAFANGAFETGFLGPESTFDNTVQRLRVCVDPTNPLTGATMTVRVVATAPTLPVTYFDETYEVAIEDLSGPGLVSVIPMGKKVLRLTFDEAVVEATALVAANYALALAEGEEQTRLPAVQVVASSVAKLAETVFDVFVDIEMTPRATYDLTVGGVEDDSGNTATGLTAAFVGFQPDVPADRDFSMVELVPPGALAQDTSGDLRNFLECYQEVVDLLLCEIDSWGDVLDYTRAPENIVDIMLRDLGNPFTFALSLVDKRRLIPVLVPIYKQKYTGAGIINAIRFFLGIEATIEVPALTGTALGVGTLGGTLVLGSNNLGDLLTFCVVLPSTVDATTLATMVQIIDYMMRGEEHYKIVAPQLPTVTDHWSLGLSRLGGNTILH